MPMTTQAASGGPILRPAEVHELITLPAFGASVAVQMGTVVQTASHDFRVPLVVADPSAAWVPEGTDITPSDADVDELVITPPKLAGLTIITRELADDSDPAAQQVVGDGLARDIARKIDAAFFTVVAAPAPAGLAALSGASSVVNAAAFGSVDYFAEAQSKAELVGATIDRWAMHPTTALTLDKVREATGSNKPLLQPDPTQPGRRTIRGVPVLVSPAIPVNVAWGVDSSRVLIVVRDDVRLDVDRSRYFESDRIGIRATMRVGFAFPHAASVVKIAIA